MHSTHSSRSPGVQEPNTRRSTRLRQPDPVTPASGGTDQIQRPENEPEIGIDDIEGAEEDAGDANATHPV